MKLRSTIAIAISTLILVALPNAAVADSAKPGQSMTHMKTAAGAVSYTHLTLPTILRV